MHRCNALLYSKSRFLSCTTSLCRAWCSVCALAFHHLLANKCEFLLSLALILCPVFALFGLREFVDAAPAHVLERICKRDIVSSSSKLYLPRFCSLVRNVGFRGFLIDDCLNLEILSLGFFRILMLLELTRIKCVRSGWLRWLFFLVILQISPRGRMT